MALKTPVKKIADPEVQLLAGIASTLRADYDSHDLAWEGSPFAWMRSRPSRQRGKICEQLVAGWLAAKGFNVARSPDAEADRLIESKRVEIKSSTLWQAGFYKFQQFRDQRYDLAICLGISPFDAHCWVIPKATIMDQWKKRDGVEPQHGGRKGTDTAWLTVTPGQEPAWLRSWGGRLATAVNLLRELTGLSA